MSEIIIRAATGDDLHAVEALRRADGDSLGFVPKQKYEHIVHKTLDRGRTRWRYERLIVSEDNGDVTGFCLSGFHRDGAKIEQVCVREDARRMERALRLVDDAEREGWRRGSLRIRCRVAADIDANFFWCAAGFMPIGTTLSTWQNLHVSKVQRPLVIYEKELIRSLQTNLFEVPGLEAIRPWSDVA